tara:strand:+ start:633 stop:3020 length:2388 start_codon:yes stop_codon:yes gene_type:complete
MKEHCVLTTKIFKEIIDKKLLENLLCHPELLGTWIDGYGIERNDRKQLIDILTSLKGNKLSIKYGYSKKTKKKDPFGRVFPEGLISLGSLGRKIRGTLTTGNYIDIDIVNCHATFMLYFLKKYSFPHSTYDKYVNDRNTYLKLIQKNYNCSRDESKKFFIIAGYGGSYNSWFNNLGEDCEINGISQEPLWNLFRAEAKVLANKFIDTNQERFNDWSENRDKDYNYDFGFLGMMLQDYERQVLETMYLFFIKEGLIKNNNVILCHDGIMLLIKSIKKETLIRLQNLIKEQHGFNVSLINKPMKHYLDKLKEKKIIDEGEPMDINYFGDLQTYKQKKEYFERYFCKILNTSEFVFLNITYENNKKTYNHIRFTEFNLVTSYKHYPEHLLFKEDDVKKKLAPKSFISKWLNDKTQRVYKSIGWSPYNGTYKQDNLHKFNLFVGYSPLILNPKNLPVDTKQIAPFLDVLLNLCENNEKYLDFLIHYLAHTIQRPQDKLPISMVFTGMQGTGKDTLLYALGKIMGESFVLSSSDINVFLGEHATGLVEKIAVAFNESEAHKSFNYEGIIKTLVTDGKMTVNEKYKAPYQANMIARMFFFSNKQNPIFFDSVSKDRRFTAMKTTEKYADAAYSQWWSSLYKHMKTEKFIFTLYHYLNNIDLTNYNFSAERLKVLGSTYRQMCRQQLPPVADWLGEYLSKGELLDTECKEPEDNLYSDYKNWQRKNRPDTSKDNGFIGDKRKFKSTLKHLGVPMVCKRWNKGGNRYHFTPKDVYAFIVSKNWVDGLDFLEDSEEENFIEFEL